MSADFNEKRKGQFTALSFLVEMTGFRTYVCACVCGERFFSLLPRKHVKLLRNLRGSTSANFTINQKQRTLPLPLIYGRDDRILNQVLRGLLAESHSAA